MLRGYLYCGPLEERALPLVVDQRLDFPLQLLVAGALRRQIGRTFFGRAFQRGMVELLDAPPAFRSHGLKFSTSIRSVPLSSVCPKRKDRPSGETEKPSPTDGMGAMILTLPVAKARN